MKNVSVLFVCLGNICRSPIAHGVFRHKVAGHGLSDVVTVDSAGTSNDHPNSPPDARSQAQAAKRGYDLSDLRARQIQASDFETFDLILVMDWDNLAQAKQQCPAEHQHKVRRFTEFCLQFDSPVVPDPQEFDDTNFALSPDPSGLGLPGHFKRDFDLNSPQPHGTLHSGLPQ